MNSFASALRRKKSLELASLGQRVDAGGFALVLMKDGRPVLEVSEGSDGETVTWLDGRATAENEREDDD